MEKAGTFRPFSVSAGVYQRSYSLPLQRVLTDFGSEEAFNQVGLKLKEHYGIEVPSHAARSATLQHARQIEQQQAEELGKVKNLPKEIIISQTDGSMVPLVKIDPESKDKRKNKKVHYREARLTLAHEKGSTTPLFSGTLGDVKEVGEHMAHCVSKVGMNTHTKIHAVGDGAVWIADQIEERFGTQATYLVDFYHLCEYLALAANDCCEDQTQKEWMEQQKNLLKENQAQQVLNNLSLHLESNSVKDEEAPVRNCHRYLKNRLHQVDYKSALENDLPIGSGEIESAHRYVIQSRIKIQGAWWLETNAACMLALRTKRANKEWTEYWEKLAA